WRPRGGCGSRAAWDQLEGRLFAEFGGIARLRRAESWSVLAAIKLGDPAGLGSIGDMPCLDLDVLASQVQDPSAPRRQVLRPLASHALAGQDEQMLPVGCDEDRHIRRFAGLPAIGFEGDLALILRGLDNVLTEFIHARF